MKTGVRRYERAWGTGLIVAGVAVLTAVGLLAFAIIRDPGGQYDRWVPAESVEQPEASFAWVSSGLAVEFTDSSQPGASAIQSWRWDFGDGSQSSEPNPSRSFPEGGEWVVTLEVADADGLTSEAEGTLEIESGASNNGDGTIGLGDMADRAIGVVRDATKGGLIVLLILGMFVVMTLIGGRFLRQGVRLLRPLPDRISLKLRPKEFELTVVEAKPSEAHTGHVVPTSGALRGEDSDTAQQSEPIPVDAASHTAAAR